MHVSSSSSPLPPSLRRHARSACRSRRTSPPGTPHITWVLMYGDRNNADDEFACQSEPKTECVIPASRPDAQSFADVHFYFHGAGDETKYEGTTSIGFLQGGQKRIRAARTSS